jgi:hypothetical protein
MTTSPHSSTTDAAMPYASLTPDDNLSITLATLTAAMTSTEQELETLTTSRNRTALRARQALNLLNTCRSKFVDMMEAAQ